MHRVLHSTKDRKINDMKAICDLNLFDVELVSEGCVYDDECTPGHIPIMHHKNAYENKKGEKLL